MKRENPFPGMNPWVQRVWHDVHTMLIAYIRDAIFDNLPPDLTARTEEGVVLREGRGKKEAFKGDVTVSESEGWKQGERPTWKPDSNVALAEPVTKPVLVTISEITPRWIEIRKVGGDLVTVIEIASPANKTLGGREAFDGKMGNLLHSGVSTMEIDFIRNGLRASDTRVGDNWPIERCQIVVDSPWNPGISEVWPCPLREPLPVVRVPLREGELGIALHLQELFDRCHLRGNYRDLPYSKDPSPPLSPEDLEWARELLAAAE